MKWIAGVDEAGRGPIAGPVVAAAVILPENITIRGVKDSKKVAENRREHLYEDILRQAVAVGTGVVHENDIDNSNILAATFRAMRIALGQLRPQPSEAVIDGFALPDQLIANRGVVRGDERIHSVSAASIVAKVTRDRMMRMYHSVYPEYGFDRHKGYATREHLSNLEEFRACPIHRRSFNPVMNHMPARENLKTGKLLGRLGERVAATRLIHRGYRILEMNYNAAPYGEIDIVAKTEAAVVFVEVKSAGEKSADFAGYRMNARKIRRLANAFEVYAHGRELTGDFRFDLMTVSFGRKGPIVRQYKDFLN